MHLEFENENEQEGKSQFLHSSNVFRKKEIASLPFSEMLENTPPLAVLITHFFSFR